MARWCVALLAMFLSAEVFAAPALTVRVVNLANLNSHDLTAALEATTALYAEAGISVNWVVCGPCDTPLTRRELWLRVASSPLTAGTTLGDAALNPRTGTGIVATIYADRVERASRESGARVERLLGLTIAHELGHLLIGSVKHDHTGIMRSGWSTADLRSAQRFAFTQREGFELRAGLSQRATTHPDSPPEGRRVTAPAVCP